MTNLPSDHVTHLAEEIGGSKVPDSYALGRIRGYVKCADAGEMSPESALDGIRDVLDAVNLTLTAPSSTRTADVTTVTSRPCS